MDLRYRIIVTIFLRSYYVFTYLYCVERYCSTLGLFFVLFLDIPLSGYAYCYNRSIVFTPASHTIVCTDHSHFV
jgi:hypothetical protein